MFMLICGLWQDKKSVLRTFISIIGVALLVYEVVGYGVLVHDIAKEGLHVDYHIVVLVSIMIK